MNEIESVLTIKEYGKIKICLKALLEEKEITRNYLAKRVDTNFEVINKWCKGTVERMDLDLLARVCYVLGCEPADIIKYDQINANAVIEIEAKIEDDN